MPAVDTSLLLFINPKMKTFTKEQLIKAQIQWNKSIRDNPEGFGRDWNLMSDAYAEAQVSYLIGLIPQTEALVKKLTQRIKAPLQGPIQHLGSNGVKNVSAAHKITRLTGDTNDQIPVYINPGTTIYINAGMDVNLARENYYGRHPDSKPE